MSGPHYYDDFDPFDLDPNLDPARTKMTSAEVEFLHEIQKLSARGIKKLPPLFSSALLNCKTRIAANQVIMGTYTLLRDRIYNHKLEGVAQVAAQIGAMIAANNDNLINKHVTQIYSTATDVQPATTALEGFRTLFAQIEATVIQMQHAGHPQMTTRQHSGMPRLETSTSTSTSPQTVPSRTTTTTSTTSTSSSSSKKQKT